MSAAFPQRIAFEQALSIIEDSAQRAECAVERVAPANALGRVLACELVAPMPLQPFDNAAMDGFALRHADLATVGSSRLRLAGEQFAAASRGYSLRAGECVRITTGAPLPDGADTVAIKEAAVVEAGAVTIPADIRRGSNVRRTGEDVGAGETVLRRGIRLTAAQVSLVAALGLASLPVVGLPRVRLFSTGDELREPGQSLAHGEIYDSNAPLLRALLLGEGIDAVAGRLRDEPQAIRRALDAAAEDSDLIITCGGVSAGEKDHLPALLAAHGEPRFWRVRMKPGMPVLFGRWRSALLLGLPGNPVSVLATFLTLGRALLDGLQGCTEVRPEVRARLASSLVKSHARLEFQRARLHVDAEGTLVATPDPATGSHRLRAAAEANALIRLPEGPLSLAAGDVVTVLPMGPLRAD